MPSARDRSSAFLDVLLVRDGIMGVAVLRALVEHSEVLTQDHKGRQLVVHLDANGASGAPRCPPHAIAHQPSLTYCFFHSSALIGSSEMPYTASTFTWSVNKPRWRPSDTRAACLSCILTRSAPFTVCETSATAAAASSLILSASTIVTRGIMTITGSPSLPFSVRVTSSLRQLTTLRMSEKPISLSSRTTCSTVTSARSAPARPAELPVVLSSKFELVINLCQQFI